MFEFVEVLLRRHKKHPHKPQEAVHSQRREMYNKIISELNSLEKGAEKKIDPEHTSKFYNLVKLACTQALNLKYEATFQEIQKEVKKRPFTTEIREKTIEFLDDVALMEYGYPQFREAMQEKLRSREAQLKVYIKDLENQGDKIKSDTKKKISQIVSETMPHNDKELLLEMLRRFKEILPHIFR